MSDAVLAPRMSRVRPSPTAVISDKVRALALRGLDVINLGEGELDFPTPPHICAAGIAAIERGDTKYTAVAGTPALKAAIIAKFERENGLVFQSHQVIAGTGAKQLVFNALLATVAPGDEVIVPAPYWVSYPDMVALAEGEAKIVPCHEADGWKLTAAALEAAITPRTRWIILNSPNNPSGAVYTREEVAALCAVLLRHPHVLVMADDIYEHLVYEGTFATPAAVEPRLASRVLTINGVSKTHSMTGWRLGFAAGPDWLIAAMETLQSQSTSNPSTISQAAALAALNGGVSFLDDWRGLLCRRRDLVLEAVRGIDGLRAAKPTGAFYVWVDCSGLFGRRSPAGGTIRDDFDVADYLLDAAQVGMVPGSAFGSPGHLRVAYAIDEKILKTAFEQIATACAALT
ncbi:MAG: pyridoxal phosphate-dependent aminotransferase [Azospirillaceae bacterium]|nr:pyridoxal phosphate-dependent aminotransferase [Azospirillaceae bacterium]